MRDEVPERTEAGRTLLTGMIVVPDTIDGMGICLGAESRKGQRVWFDAPAAYDPAPAVTVEVLTDDKKDAGKGISVALNGSDLKLKKRTKGVCAFEVPPQLVKKGRNSVTVKAVEKTKIVDFVLRIVKAKP